MPSNANPGAERISILIVGGMQDAACAQKVEAALKDRPEVLTVGINLLTRMATIRHRRALAPAELIRIVTELGFTATLASAGESHATPSLGEGLEAIASRKSRFVAGAILTFIIVLVDQMMAVREKTMWLFLLATPVQITVGWEYYRGFFAALRRRTFNLDSLVVMGSTAAYLQGVLAFVGSVSNDRELMNWPPMFVASAMILTVVSLGKWLEARARESTTKQWGSLMEMAPRQARVLRDGREQVIPAGVVALGDIVVVREGEKIPIDGVVVSGSSEVNETLITGEGRPVPKVKGDKVLVASLNIGGTLHVRTTGAGETTTLAQINRMVAQAQNHKAPVQLLADRISAILVPVTFAISVATFLTWYFGPFLAFQLAPEWTAALDAESWFAFLAQEATIPKALMPAIAVLVVACPCAVGLATSTVTLVASGLGARRGLLLKGGQAIEAAGRVSDVVFDKTGILTDGSFRAQAVFTAEGVDRDEFLNLAASLEACSESALAKGVINEAKKGTLILRKVERFEALSGRGLKGRIGGRTFLLGSRTLLEERGVTVEGALGQRTAEAEADGMTTIFLAEEKGRVLGALAMTDRLKETAPAAIQDLRAMRLKVHLFSGDNPSAALAVGKRCGMAADEVHARMTLEDKVDFAWTLREQGRRVAMVGDGIHQAPVMAAADVGLALGAGTDISVESGSAVLVSGDPRGVARMIHLCREALRLIRWNLLWAFAFNVVMIPLAALNFFSQSWALPVAAAAMAASSILVVLNSLRLTDARVDAPGLLPTPVPHPTASPAAALATPIPGTVRTVKDK